MPTIDGWLEGFLQGPTTPWVALLVSLLLGLRHASDPDHLAAVTTLIASEHHQRIKKAPSMGLLWGLGHGTTLIVVGLPLVLLGQYLPERVGQAAEVAIGAIIVVLALRLLVRWHRGVFHAHAHSHTSGETHRHLHSHASGSVHEHAHDVTLRTPLSAYGVGLVHGVGGSGGITLLLLSTIEKPSQAVVALLIFAAVLKKDLAAVRAGLTEEWSNGPVEGFVHKLKLLKRQGYGRSGFDLLRTTMLAA